MTGDQAEQLKKDIIGIFQGKFMAKEFSDLYSEEMYNFIDIYFAPIAIKAMDRNADKEEREAIIKHLGAQLDLFCASLID